jgi:hypothetical protein
MTTRVFPLICLVAWLGLFAGVARAEAPRLVASGEFASFADLGVAVDQASGDVFVTPFVDLSEHKINVGRSAKFDASGELLSSLSSFPEGGGYYGAAVNPTNGDLYVVSVQGELGTYDPNTGALLSSFSVPSFFLGVNELLENTAQIAADSAGNVYVSNVLGNEVLEYSPTGTPLQTFTGSGAHALHGPTGVAVAPSGDVWVADDGDNSIEEFSPAGAFLAEIKSEGVRALALDGHGDVLAIVDNSADSCGGIPSPCEHLVEYSSSGAQLADVGAGTFGSVSTSYPPFSMVAVDDESGRVYVTDGESGVVWAFQPPALPAVGKESAAEVGVVEAKLGALVTPGGGEATYRFEYDTREYSEGEGSHGVSVPFPEGSAGQGFSSRTVWAAAKDLQPSTTYHYRAVVTNALGTVVGPDQTFTTETAAQTACPNERSRSGFSAALPDCRAYEAVVPPSKFSVQPLTIEARYGFPQAANDGNGFAWTANEVLPGSQSAGLEDIATRGASGWPSEDVLPLQFYDGNLCALFATEVLVFSPDLSKEVVLVGSDSECDGESREVVPGETRGVENLLLRDNATGAYQLIDVPPPGVTATDTRLIAYSADLNLVIFSNGSALTAEAPNGGTFEWSEGVVRLLKLTLPSGEPVEGSIVSISPDGSEVFFTADGNLYVRLRGGERTVQVDEAQGGSGPGGGGSFRAVTADGSRVLFTDAASAGLTSDTVPGSGRNLYSFDIGSGQLSDLTPVAHAEASLAGISEDGSYVYFTAEAVMSGSQANQFGEIAESAQANLYLSHGGTLTFVKHGGEASLSPNGAFVEFHSTASLTGYDNNGQYEIYLYDAASNRFACATCNPSGEAPTGGGVDELIEVGGNQISVPHPVSNNGQVFFQTSEALLPRDTNGVADVYEYDYASGLHLISTGTSSIESRLLGASASGNDVFFLGRQALLPGETDGESLAIYDARVDGGFPEPAVPPACVTAEACRAAPAPQPSIFGEPSSQTFSGAGNLASPEAEPKAKPRAKSVKCGKDSVKRRGKCVKKPGKKTKKSARANGRGK